MDSKQPATHRPSPDRTPDQPEMVTGFFKRSNRRIITAAIVLIIIGLIPGWVLLWRSESREPVSNASAATDVPIVSCGSGLKSYENTFMGIGFCYPAAWGEAYVQEGKFDPADKGSRWRMAFTAKTEVAVGLVSTDWTSVALYNVSCGDPATPIVPPFTSIVTAWETEGLPVASGSRGIEAKEGHFRIEEYVADLETNGVCLRGYAKLGGIYQQATATYLAEFSPVITSPEQHIATPTVLIPPSERAAFAMFVQSIRKL